MFWLFRFFDTGRDCLLFSISLFATDNFYLVTQMKESGL